ncbi:hypothetical protein Landi51_02582 [Colletotrichum acutatum]
METSTSQCLDVDSWELAVLSGLILSKITSYADTIPASDARNDSPVTDGVATGTAELATIDKTSVICGARSEVVLIEVGATSGDPVLAILIDVARVEQAGCELADRSDIRTRAVGQDADDFEVGGGLVLGDPIELEELLVDVVLREEDELELELEVELAEEVLLAREDEDELDEVDDEVEPGVFVVVADVDEVVEEDDDDLVKVENVEALDEVNNVLSAALAEELEEELEEELVDDVEDDEVIAVLDEELVELEKNVEDVEVLVVDVDELVVDAKLAALTVTLEDEVLERMLLELLLLLVEALLLIALVLLLLVPLVVGIRVAGFTVTLVDGYEEVLDILLVVEILVVELVAELLVVALLDVETRLAWFAVGEAVELLEEPLEDLLEVLLRDIVLDIELLVVGPLVEVLVVELVVDNRVAALTVTLEEVADELRAELLDDGLVVVPLLVDTEIEELAEVGDVELVEELLLVDVLLVVDTNEAASTVGLDEVDGNDVVSTEELPVALGEELVAALKDEDETVGRLIVEALLVVDRSVAALAVGLDEEDKEGEEEDLADELKEGGKLLAELLEGAAVELVLGDSNVAGLTVALMEEVVLGTVLLVAEPTLDVKPEDDDGLLAEVLEDDPAALLVVGSSVAALKVGLADAKLLSELLLDAVPLEVELELTAELED